MGKCKNPGNAGIVMDTLGYAIEKLSIYLNTTVEVTFQPPIMNAIKGIAFNLQNFQLIKIDLALSHLCLVALCNYSYKEKANICNWVNCI